MLTLAHWNWNLIKKLNKFYDRGLTMVEFSVIIRHMQKKINYFLFIVQGRGFHQRVELDRLGVVPRFVILPIMNHISDKMKRVVEVSEWYLRPHLWVNP